MQRFISAFFLAMLIPAAAFAHSGGAVFEKPVDGKLIRVTYSTDEIAPLVPVRFTFDLVEEDRTAVPADFTRVWVKVEEGPALRLVSWLASPSVGQTSMSYAFPREGKYLLTARYENEAGEKLAEASFELEVMEAERSLAVSPEFLAGMGAGLAAAGLAWAVRRARKK